MKLLIVDDALLNRRHYEIMANDIEDCEIIAFDCAEKALGWCDSGGRPDFVVTDHVLPGMSGIDFLQRIRELPSLGGVPTIMISASEDKDVRRKAFAAGVLDFIAQPVDHFEFPQRIRNFLMLRRRFVDESSTADWLAAQVRSATAQLLERERQVVGRLARIAEYRDPETGLHAARVGSIAKVIAERLGLSKDEVEAIFLTAPLHDVGKISVPDYILLKTGKLTQLEFEIMKQHTIVGYELLRDDTSTLLNTAATIALAHHERFDGTGYPKGLAGDAIPLPGRICAIADTFDVLTSWRPYRPALSIDDAIAEIRRCKGTQLDPRVVGAFDAAIEQVVAVKERMTDSPSASVCA